MSREHRKLKRWQLITYLDVFDLAGNCMLGLAMDITVEGMLVRSRMTLEADRRYDLRVTLPAELKGLRTFDVRARCASCTRSSNPDLYDAGFQFLDLAPDAVEAIEELIHRFTH